MPKLLERRKKPRRKAVQVTGPTWVMLENVPGARADIRAKVVDFNETGLRIHVSLLLHTNHVVVVKGQAAGVVPDGRTHARVVDCRSLTGSGYSVGLTFESEHQEPAAGKPAQEMCDILTLNPAAGVRFQVSKQGNAAEVRALEKSKRRGILELLYTARTSQPSHSTVSLKEMEDLLGCTRDDLDFTLWYLRENALISIPEQSCYTITAKGVDYLEELEATRLGTDQFVAG